KFDSNKGCALETLVERCGVRSKMPAVELHALSLPADVAKQHSVRHDQSIARLERRVVQPPDRGKLTSLNLDAILEASLQRCQETDGVSGEPPEVGRVRHPTSGGSQPADVRRPAFRGRPRSRT